LYDDSVTSGFLIEKTFARVCREYLAWLAQIRSHRLNKGYYSTPRTDVPPEQMPKQYRGLQREPMQAWDEILRGSGVVEPTDQELEASLFFLELEKAGKAADDFIFAPEDARELLGKVAPPVELEIVWARRMDVADEPPLETVLLGYEPSAFYPPTCDSAVAGGMFFGGPVPNDEEGLRLKAFHEKLNKWGLFDTPTDAEQYLEAYLSLVPPDWDEHKYTYYTTEVRAIAD
jgi:hypothetical protein